MSTPEQELITPELVDLDLEAADREAATAALARRLHAHGRVSDLAGFLADLAAREEQMPTGMEGGIGIPHARSAHVLRPSLAFGRAQGGVDFGAEDGIPADLIFMIAAPDGADDSHLRILASLARRLADQEFTTALRSAQDPGAAAALLRGDDSAAQQPDAPDAPDASDAPDAPDAPDGAGETAAPSGTTKEPPTEEEQPDPPEVGEETPEGREDAAPFRLVAVTSCPTGIAHTYMAAELLEQAAQEAGAEIHVETQGSAGFERLDPATVRAADAVIFAHDVEVRDRSRFAGKPTVDVPVKSAIGPGRADGLVTQARGAAERAAATGEVHDGTAGAVGENQDGQGEERGQQGEGWGARLRTWLMTGVSHMVPFVAAGGLLMALSFALGGYDITEAKSVADHFDWGEVRSWAALLNQIGNASFDFLVPVLAGFIAYGMADRPGLVPGFVGGAIALTIDAGFLGGLAAGLLAGASVLAIQRVRIPAALRGIMPVLVIPLLSSAVVGFLMFVVVGKPIAWLQSTLTSWLNGLSGANAVLLGVLLGLMICFDMGGPLNKVAYTFAVGGLADPTSGSLKVMAAVMAAGMVPPLALALSTVLRPRLYSRTERENGKAAWVLGASFITEGAIPFAAADPLRVIPAGMAGGAVTGALSMAFGSTLRAPHGGLFVVPLIGSPLLYLVAIIAGLAVSAFLVTVLKQAAGGQGNSATGKQQAENTQVENAQAGEAQVATEEGRTVGGPTAAVGGTGNDVASGQRDPRQPVSN